jgi:zinc protease
VFRASAILAACAALLVLQPAAAQPARKAAPPKAVATSPLSNLKIDIPYEKFVLKNGLTLIVHEDRKAPIVAVNVWYHVGSKNEPRGRSGFAHLFEHLMFNGSENFNDDFFKATQRLGATAQNGTTNVDRTNYFQNVPKEALDSILWLESDRMGHLLGAISQARLDEQRGVVQNEKRQGENQPYGKVYERIVKATYPEEHPYGHTVIGSMEDLDAAKLEDVREWFRTYYGPSNAVIVLAGDITPAEAKAKVEKYFGEIPPGPPVSHPKAWVAKRTGAQKEVMEDRVAQPRLYKVWNVPEYGHTDGYALDVFADVLAGDKTSRLTRRLVYEEQLATDVSVSNDQSEIAGQFDVTVTAKPGVDLDRIERIVDEEMARLIAGGPTAAELSKTQVRITAGMIRGLERVGGFGGKSDLLALSHVYLGSPDGWKRWLEGVRTVSAADVRAKAREWLTDGSYSLHVVPFPSYAPVATGVDRKTMPAPGAAAPARFPQFQRETLSNGLKVLLVERHELPTVEMQLVAETGYGADWTTMQPGVGALAMRLVDEGTTTRDGMALADELERLGASISAGGGGEVSFVSLSALSPTLRPALAIFADVIQNPAFRDADFQREKARQVAAIQSAKRQPAAIASRVLQPLLYGPDHPYGRIQTEASVQAISREDLIRFHREWFRPDASTLIVVGDVTMAQLRPQLEAAFAGWKPGAPRRIDVTRPPRPPRPALSLVDQPGALQSMIVAAGVVAPRNARDEIAIEAFNNVLGGSFVSRLNMNLREDKHWSYGAQSGLLGARGPRIFRAQAPVQTDKTRESLLEMQKELRDVLRDRQITAAEIGAAREDLALRLSGRWETAGAVGASLTDLVLYGLPDDYFASYADKLRAIDQAQATQAGSILIPDQNLVWVVVGDRAKIEADLRSLNLGPIQVIDADGRPVS